MKFVRAFIGAKQHDVLLAERQVDLGEVVQGSELPRIHRFQPDMGHRSGDRLRFVLPLAVVLTLLHTCSTFSFLAAPSRGPKAHLGERTYLHMILDRLVLLLAGGLLPLPDGAALLAPS